MLVTVIARSIDDDLHYLIPAAEIERIENERYRQLAAIAMRRPADEPLPEM
jgi:cytochrome o ubiquinol oxidase subunit 1